MKKLINILSIFSLTATSSLSVISCSEEKEIPKLTLAQEETDIVNAINLKNVNSDNSNVTIDDITLIKVPTVNGTNISYDITIKKDAKTFLNNNFTYRITEVIGNFDIWNNKISNKIFEINYFPGKYSKYINGTVNILTGTTNDFTLIMNMTDLVGLEDMPSDFRFNTKMINQFLEQARIYNSNIILTKDDWKKIFSNETITRITHTLGQGYAGCMHIIKNANSDDFEVSYTNLTDKDKYSMPLPEGRNWSLTLTAFQSSEDIEDGSLIKTNNKFITLNKDILSELKDIYDAKIDNEDYGNKNWNINSISKILENNNYSKTNLDYNTISECIYNNWNINIVNNFLSKNYYRTYRNDNGQLVDILINFLTLQYDKDNKYIKNNLNI